jgi:hypothetical protein
MPGPGAEFLQTSANGSCEPGADDMAAQRVERLDARTREGRAGRPEKRCEACGEPIPNPRRGQRFCYWPRRCRVSHWAEQNRRPYLDPRPPRPCERCGEPIQDPRRNQRFCRRPRDCRQLAGYERTPEFRRAHARDGDLNAAPAGAGIVDEGARPVVSSLAVISPSRSGRAAEVSPMVAILIESMPAPGSIWPRDARTQWLAILERTLDALYPGEQ